MQVLLDLLPERVGSLLSVNALREDVGVAYATVRAWVVVLQSLYHCFLVRPYSKRVQRSLRNAPKLYLYDGLGIPKERIGARLENLTALHLLKACEFWTDSAAGHLELFYVRDKEQREVDFLITREKKPWLLVECRSSDKEPSAALLRYTESLKPEYSVQLVTIPSYDREYPQKRVRVMSYEAFLATLV